MNHLDLGVDVFFCISGFIMYMLIHDLTPTIGAATKFIANRAIRVFPPYWFFSTLIVAAYLLSKGNYNLGKFVGNSYTDGIHLLSSLLLIPEQQSPVLPVGWTLVHESLFYILCTLVLLARANRRLPEILGSLSLIAVALSFFGISLWHGYLLSPFYIEFFLGALAFRYRDSIRVLPFAPIFVALICYVLLSNVLDSGVLASFSNVVRPLGAGMIGFLLIVGLIGVDKKIHISSSGMGKVLMGIGDASYTLYLMHWFVLSIMGKLIGLTPGIPLLAVILWHLLSIASSVVVAVIFAERIELPTHRKLQSWFGGDNKIPSGEPGIACVASTGR
jgi:peptidoglycan/LPS O-acetylase OafA/YrhL